jgi:hypothetical protein
MSSVPGLTLVSSCDHDKTIMPYTEHEEEMLCGIVWCEVSAKLTDEYVDDNDQSNLTNDESINTFNFARGVHINDDGKFNMDMTDKEREHFLEQSLKKLGNMSCKPIYKYTITDLFQKGMLLMTKNLHTTQKRALEKVRRKQELIFISMRFFKAQMTDCQEQH